MRTVAVTGATGFLGRHVVAALASRGWRLRLLVRQAPIDAGWRDAEPEIVLGSLSDRLALARLVDGADAVLNLAGLIKAPSEAEFMRVNRDGSALLAEIVAAEARNAHFVQVSSLAARSPALSGYAASKRAGEDVVRERLGSARLSVIRPPAIYGPGDRETLAFFKLGGGAFIPLPQRPKARFALIHAEDAAAAIVARLEAGPSGAVETLSDHRPAGYSWREILGAAAAAVGNERPRFLTVPAWTLKGVGAVLGTAARAGLGGSIVNAGKIRELLHEDWAVREAERLHLPEVTARYELMAGFVHAATWYRANGWL